MKLWNVYKLNKEIEDFTVGEDYILDQKLVKYDCIGSMAHAEMLGKIGVFKEEEVKKIAQDVINNLGAESLKDMGKVMGPIMNEFKGKADGALVSKIVKEELSK